jgi:hypothetical protein
MILNDELKRMRVWPILGLLYYRRIFLEGLNKTTTNPDCLGEASELDSLYNLIILLLEAVETFRWTKRHLISENRSINTGDKPTTPEGTDWCGGSALGLHFEPSPNFDGLPGVQRHVLRDFP